MLTRVAAVAAAVAFVAFIGLQLSNLNGTVGSSQSPSPSGSTEATSSPSPSSSVSPSASSIAPQPTDAPLLLRLWLGNEAGAYHAMTVLEDGRVITTADPGSANAPVERRLAAAGIQLIRIELAATGLADRSADYFPIAKPGVEPPPYGGAPAKLEVAEDGGGTVVITWFLHNSGNAYFEPQPEAEALEAFGQRLLTLDEWLPADAWAESNPVPYAPEAYVVRIETQAWGGSLDDLGPETSSVSWPLAGGIDGFGDLMNETGEPSVRCGVVDANQGSEIIDALVAAGATQTDLTYPAFALGKRASVELVTIDLEPILPHTDAPCASPGNLLAP